MVAVSDSKVKVLAKMVHEANKAFCEGIGDFSQVPWNEAPDYNHRSAMVGVRAICVKPDLTPEECHDAWMEAKRADGWVYGETKCRDKKTHPSLVPFADLSPSEQYKDCLVIAIVKSYLDFL